MKILTRYLLKEHAAPFLFALAALTGLLLLNQIARRFGDLMGKGLPWTWIVEVFALSLPFILAMTVPMACLVAVLQAFSRLGQDAEITALKASGVNLVSIMRPVLLAFSIIGLAEFVFIDQYLPKSNHDLKNLLVDITRKKPTFELREQAVNEVVTGQLFLRAGRIDQATDRMRNVVIYDLANPQHRRTIYADSGYMRFNTERTDLFLRLFHGYVHDYDRAQAATFRRIFYATDLIRVKGVANRVERSGENDYRSDREMSICDMEQEVQNRLRSVASIQSEQRHALERDALALVGVVAPATDTAPPQPRHNITSAYCALLKQFRTVGRPTPARAETPDQAGSPAVQRTDTVPPAPAFRRPMVAPDPSGGQLKAALTSLDAARKNAVMAVAGPQVEIHKKYSLAVSCVVFVLIGAPLALRFPRGGAGMVIGASVVIFGFYYIGLIGGESLARRQVITPFWAMWTPNLVMAVIGSWLFLRLGRERATARSGRIRDWLETRRRRRLKARTA